MVSMDSLRGDHCDMLDSRRSLTPTMDRLAREGVNFHNAVATGPQTFSSMPAVFTGHPRQAESLDEYPGETHWERRLAAVSAHLEQFGSFTEQLQRRGYTTAGISPNPWTSSATGFDRGFDRFVDLSSEREEGRLPKLLGKLPGIDTDDRAVDLAINMLTGSSFFAKWSDLYDRLEQVRKSLPEPYFLWVFLLDTHYPFLVARKHREEQSLFGMYHSAYRSEKLMRGRTDEQTMPPDIKKSLLRGYRDTVRASDAFLDRLHSDGEDDPVMVIHSDHGESFGEHGNYGHHHRQMYEENVHVPYLIHNASATGEVREPVSLASIPETIREISRTGTVNPETHTSPYVFSQSECGSHRTVRGSRFKYVESQGKKQLFDLTADPEETENIANVRPSLLASLQEMLAQGENTHTERRKLALASREIAENGTF